MVMLYLVRHAAAEEGGAGVTDEARALTQDGIRKFRRAAQGIVKLLEEKPPRVILTSPLVRARQTAGILREAFDQAKYKAELRVSKALAPPGQLQALLKDMWEQGDTVAVAHDPFLSEWVGTLCFGKAGHVELKKGALAAVELAERGATGRLLYLLQPGILRQLG